MLTAVQVLAENNFGDTRTGSLAGPTGLFIIVLLAIATVLLIRNMNARLRRLPDRFSVEGETEEAGRDLSHSADPASGPEDETIGSAPAERQQDRNSPTTP